MPVEINRKRFLSVQETSRELGLSYPTILSYLRKGKLQGVRVGRSVLIPEEKVHALLAFPEARTIYRETA